MKKFLLYVLAVFFILPQVLFSTNRQDAALPVAVLDFEAPDLSTSARIVLSNVVRKELMNTGSFIVVDRNNMNQILEEHDFQETGFCTNLDCMVQAGRLLGVRKMIGGSIGLLGKRYMIDLKIVDVETGKIVKMDSEDHFGALESIDKPIVTLIKRLVGVEVAVKSGTFIYVTSKPEGARIYLNNTFKGNAPINIPLEQDGQYLVEAKLGGYSSWQQSVGVKMNETSYVNASLVKSDVGTMQVMRQEIPEWENMGMTENEWRYKRMKKSVLFGTLLSVLPGCGHYYSKNYITGVVYTAVRIFAFAYPVLSNTDKVEERIGRGATNIVMFTAIVILPAIDMIHAGKNVSKYNKKLQEKYQISVNMKPSYNGRGVMLGLSCQF